MTKVLPADDSPLPNGSTVCDSPAIATFFSRAIYLQFGLFAIAISLFAYYVHPIERISGAENDGYVGSAELISAGKLPRDVFRPLFYPILSAAVRFVIGDSFRAAQLVSVASSIAVIALLAWLACRLTSKSAAFVATSWMALNIVFLEHSVLASTDMLWIALSLGTLCSLLKFCEQPSIPRILIVAGLFSLSFFTRYTGVALLLPVAIAILSIKPFSVRSSLKYGALFGAATLLFLIPHFVLSYRVFGVPFYTENWKNIAYKLYGNNDLSYVQQMPFNNASELLSSSWKLILLEGVNSFRNFFTTSLPNLAAPDPISRLWGYSGFAFVGTFFLIFKRTRFLGILFSFVIGYAALVSFTFFLKERLFLILLPIVYITAAYGLVDLPRRFISPSLHKRYLTMTLLIALTPFLLVLPSEVTAFWFSHPIDEAKAIQRLASTNDETLMILGTYEHGWRQAPGHYRYLPRASQAEQDDPSAYLKTIKQFCKRHKASHLIYGNASRQSRPRELFDPLQPPKWINAQEVHEDYTLYAIDLDQL